MRCRIASFLLPLAFVVAAGGLLVSASGCESMYFGAMEKLGFPKRDLLVKRVKAAQDSEEQAKEQFRSALERFQSVVHFNGGELESKYNELSAELDRSEARARDVHNRVRAVEDVSEALFDEWEGELGQYHNSRLRSESARTLDHTRARYKQMIRAMKDAESKIDPVLAPLRDNVLFLKHNLNAKAVASLDHEVITVQANVEDLIADLDRAVREADRFITGLQEPADDSGYSR